MATRTLVELRTDARRKADMEDDGNFISDAELTDYVNESIADLYDLMIDGETSQLFAKNAPILVQVGTNSYELPSDFYRLTSIDLQVGGFYIPGIPGDARETARLASNPPTEQHFKYFVRWDLTTGRKFVFIYPEIDENNLAIVYVPEAPTLVTDTDPVDGPNRWHEYIAVDAAIKMLQKQEQDTTALEFRLRRLEARIKDHIRDIDVGIPQQIRDLAHVYEHSDTFHDHLPRP